MVSAILRKPRVLALRGRSNAAHYADIQRGLFTRPVRLSTQAVGWPESEVAALNAAVIAGKNPDEIKALVQHLHAQRQLAVG